MTAKSKAASPAKEEAAREEKEDNAVEERRSAPARIIHEIVRRQGVEELERPLGSLIWSGIAAGITIWLSLITQGLLALRLPDTPWRQTISELGYSVGFIVVILGRLQLFTESTITAVLPLASRFSRENVVRTSRLWAAVFLANMAGTLAVALLVARTGMGDSDQVKAMIEVSRLALAHAPLETFTLAIPAGFILATIAWTLPNAPGQELWVILIATSVIALGGFSHVVAGSSEAWLLMCHGDIGAGAAIGGYILPVLAGNIVGGSGLFALLAHAQVRQEL